MFTWFTVLRSCATWFEPSEESGTGGSLFRFSRIRDSSNRVSATVKGDPWPVIVRNISPTRIGMLVSRPPVPGSRLVATLQNTTRRLRHTVRVNVDSVTEHPSGNWIVHGSLTPALSASEFEGLLA